VAKGFFGVLRRKGFTVDRAPTPDFNERVPTVRNTSLAHYLCGGPVPVTEFRVHDALGLLLPDTPANDDLGIASGSFGTSAPYLTTGDVKAAGCTRYARVLRPVMGKPNIQTAKVRVNAGMVTTVADGSAKVDVQAYRQAAPAVDLCQTAEQSINSLTAADKDFVLDVSNLAKNDVLDIRIKVVVADTATETAVIAVINQVQLVLT